MKKPANRPDTDAAIQAQIGARLKEARERRQRDPLSIFDRFSEEQRLQIRRLTLDLKLEAGASGNIEDTIAALAEAALWIFGLDPIAQDSFDSISRVVFDGEKGTAAFNAIADAVGNNGREAGEAWMRQHREGERLRFLEGRAA